MAYDGPGRSISIRETVKCAFVTVARIVIRYRSSGSDTSPGSLCGGWRLGTKITWDSPNCQRASPAVTRCP